MRWKLAFALLIMFVLSLGQPCPVPVAGAAERVIDEF